MASKSFEKLIEEIGNMSVLELADFVKALEENLVFLQLCQWQQLRSSSSS